MHTTNIKPGSLGWVNWFMSYLNFQIEHHLFPGMPQFRHPAVSPRVKVNTGKPRTHTAAVVLPHGPRLPGQGRRPTPHLSPPLLALWSAAAWLAAP